MYTTIHQPALGRYSIVNERQGFRRKWLLALFIAGFAFYSSGPVLRYMDTAAAVIDIGALSLPLLAILTLIGFIGISLWLCNLLWPTFRTFRKHYFEHQFKTLKPWEKIAFYMAAFFLLLFACIACLATLL
jgi:hypothetical protein